MHHHSGKTMVFIVGCQRSGTTMLLDVFYNDLSIKTYKESEELFHKKGERSLRLLDPERVNTLIKKLKPKFIVSKPLLDTQIIDRLRQDYPGSYFLWIYRDFRDVASSNLKRFGKANGHKDLRYILEKDSSDWRGELVPDETYLLLTKLYSSNSSDLEAASIFWFVRNKLYFDLSLNNDSRVLLCKYEELVRNPDKTLKNIYSTLGISVYSRRITQNIHPNSVGKGMSIDLNSEVGHVCSDLLNRLDEEYLKSDLSG